MKDEKIIQLIRGADVDKAIQALYKEFPKVRKLIAASGGSQSEARETFHDALILLIEKVQDPSFVLTAKITTYLYGINRLLWMNKLRKKQRNPELEWNDALTIKPDELGIDEEREEKLKALEKVLNEISERCRELFSRFYTQKMSMTKIAEAMGFSSPASAKTQKYKCMEQAIKLASDLNQKKA